MAVEKINASGGIAGRKISLVIHDDLGIPKEAESGDDKLIKEGAIAIIGHATSAQTLAGLKVTNPANVWALVACPIIASIINLSSPDSASSGIPRSSWITKEILRPAIPPDSLIFSTANCTPFRSWTPNSADHQSIDKKIQ